LASSPEDQKRHQELIRELGDLSAQFSKALKRLAANKTATNSRAVHELDEKMSATQEALRHLESRLPGIKFW
jgi:tryptophanyl-tRNA synthetase